MKAYLNYFNRKVAQSKFVKPLSHKVLQPIVSFTFDDVPNCGFENGIASLSKFGFTGTFYVSMKYFLDPNINADFDTTWIEKAMRENHEIGCHTYSHLEFYDTTYQTGLEDVERNQQEIEQLFPEYQFKNFAFPYGHHTQAARRITHDKFQTARGNEYGINYRNADLNNLKVFRLYEKKHTVREACKMVDRAINNVGWLIFVTHDIRDRHSNGGCTPPYFEAVVRYCHERNVHVKPIREALAFIREQSAQRVH